MKKTNTHYLTIKQASIKVGKHPDTIRNLVRKYRQTDEVTTDKKGRVLISAELLDNTYKTTSPQPPQEAETKKTGSNSSNNTTEPNQTTQTTLEALIKQLEVKDKLINDLTTLLNEKERNTLQLIDQSQRLLAGSIQPQSNEVYEGAATPIKPKPAKPQTTKQVKPVKKPAKKQPTKSLKAHKPAAKPKRHWLFGRKK